MQTEGEEKFPFFLLWTLHFYHVWEDINVEILNK